MKLQLVQVGNTDHKEVNIKNASAAVANLRAAIAITTRLESRSFTMSYKGSELTDESAKLKDLGMKDQDAITITVRRDREENNNTIAANTAAAVAVARGGVEVARDSGGGQIVAPPAPAQQGGAASSSSATTAGARGGRGGRGGGARRGGAAAGGGGGSGNPIADLLYGNHSDDDEGNSSDDDDDDTGSEDDEEWLDLDEEEADEEGLDAEDEEDRGNMYQLLQSLGPDAADLRNRFMQNPEVMMVSIAADHPDLYRLIERNPQAFLDIANGSWSPGQNAARRQQQRLAGLPPGLMQEILTGMAEQDEEGGDWDIGSDFDEEDEDVAPPAPRRAGAGGGGGQQEPQLTQQDQDAITRIVELGFSREQATQAYLAHGKNADRAGAWLFENM